VVHGAHCSFHAHIGNSCRRSARDRCAGARTAHRAVRALARGLPVNSWKPKPIQGEIMKANHILIAGTVAALLPFAAAVAQDPPSQSPATQSQGADPTTQSQSADP